MTRIASSSESGSTPRDAGSDSKYPFIPGDRNDPGDTVFTRIPSGANPSDRFFEIDRHRRLSPPCTRSSRATAASWSAPTRSRSAPTPPRAATATRPGCSARPTSRRCRTSPSTRRRRSASNRGTPTSTGPGRVHQHVEPAVPPGADHLERGRHRRRHREVARHAERVGRARGDHRVDRRVDRLLPAPEHAHPRALGREALGGGAAHPLRAAADDDCCTHQSKVHGRGFLARRTASARLPPWSPTNSKARSDPTWRESTPWWPEPERAPDGRAQRRPLRPRRRRLRAARLLRLRPRHPQHRPPRRRRPPLPALPHHRALLPHPRVPAHRAQPPLGRHGPHHRPRPRLPRLLRPHPQVGRLPLRDARRATATRRSPSASGTSRPTTRRTSRRRARRWPLGRGFERFYGFFHGETHQYEPDLAHDNHFVEPPRSRRQRATTSPRTSPTTRSSTSPTSARVDPEKPFFLYFCHRRVPLAAPRAARVDRREVPGPVRRRAGTSGARHTFHASTGARHHPRGHASQPIARRGSPRGTTSPTTRSRSRRASWSASPRTSRTPTTTSAASSTSSTASASSTTRSSCSSPTTARRRKAASTARSTTCASGT